MKKSCKKTENSNDNGILEKMNESKASNKDSETGIAKGQGKMGRINGQAEQS